MTEMMKFFLDAPPSAIFLVVGATPRPSREMWEAGQENLRRVEKATPVATPVLSDLGGLGWEGVTPYEISKWRGFQERLVAMAIVTGIEVAHEMSHGNGDIWPLFWAQIKGARVAAAVAAALEQALREEPKRPSSASYYGWVEAHDGWRAVTLKSAAAAESKASQAWEESLAAAYTPHEQCG